MRCQWLARIVSLAASLTVKSRVELTKLLTLFPLHKLTHLQSLRYGLLLQAYLTKAAAQIVSKNQLQGLLGVFQKLIASKALDHEGFKLLDSMMAHIRLQGLQQYLPTVSMPSLCQSENATASNADSAMPIACIKSVLLLAGLAIDFDAITSWQITKGHKRFHLFYITFHRFGGRFKSTAEPGCCGKQPFFDSFGASLASKFAVNAFPA